MAISFNTSNTPVNIQAGQVINPFIPAAVPTSDNPAVSSVSASGVTVSNPAWRAWLVQPGMTPNPHGTAIRIEAPASAGLGDEVTITYTFGGFDGAGNNVDPGTGTVKFVVGGQATCQNFTLAIDATESRALQVGASRFQTSGGSNLVRVVSMDLSANPSIDQWMSHGDAIVIVNGLPNGTYEIPVELEDEDGARCNAVFTIEKGVGTGGNDCFPVTINIGEGDVLAPQIFAGRFRNASSRNYTTIESIRAGAQASNIRLIQAGGNVQALQVEADLPRGDYANMAVTLATADGLTCATTLTIRKTAGGGDGGNTGGGNTGGGNTGGGGDLICNTIGVQRINLQNNGHIFNPSLVASDADFWDFAIVTPDPGATIQTIDGLHRLIIPQGASIGSYTIDYRVRDRTDDRTCTGSFSFEVIAEQVNDENNIIDCASFPPEWVNGDPRIVPGSGVTRHQVRLLDANGNRVTLPISQIRFEDDPVLVVPISNDGNGIYTVEVSIPAGTAAQEFNVRPFTV